MSAWGIRHSVVEALRNVLAAPFLFGAMTITVAVLSGGAATADLAVTHGILRAEKAYLDAGGDLLRVTPEDGAIDAASCAAARALPGVVATSAVSEKRVRLAGRPDHVQTLLLATPGLEQIVDAEPLGPGQVLASAALGDRWSWRAGTLVHLEPAIGIGESWERLGDAASTSLVVAGPPTGTAETCLVRAQAHLVGVLAETLPGVIQSTGGEAPRVERLVYTGRFGPDPSADFGARPTRWAGAVAGAVVGFLLAFVLWTRRQRSALYATLGVPWSGGVQLRLTEGLLPALAGCAWGAVWACAAGVWLGLSSDVAFTGALLQAGACLAVAAAVVVLASLWRPPTLQALKDR